MLKSLGRRTRARSTLLLVAAALLLSTVATAGCGTSGAGTTTANGETGGTASATPLTTMPTAIATEIVQGFPAPVIPLGTPALIPNGAPLRVVLQATPASGQPISPDQLAAAQKVIEQRIKLLRIPNARVAVQGPNRLIVDLPALKVPAATIATLSATGLLEIIDPAGQYLPVGTVVGTAASEPIDQATPYTGATYATILTGANLANVFLTADQVGQEAVGFEVNPAGAAKLSAFTSAHIGQPMSIVVDKRVVNTATIQGTISSAGEIVGLSPDAAAALVVKLRSGALPIPFTVVESQATP